MNTTTKPAKPCRKYLRGLKCECNDHCFNCARELDPSGNCPKGCGISDDADDSVSNQDQDEE
jgi:hypothetical protein